MAKPPATPPSSDIRGVDRDRVRIDTPENAHPDPGGQLDDAKADTKARPDGTNHRSDA